MNNTHNTFIEVPIEIEYDYQPEERPIYYGENAYPGYAEAVSINVWKICGVDIDSAVVMDWTRIMQLLTHLKKAVQHGSTENMSLLTNQLDSEICWQRHNGSFHHLIQGYLDTVEPEVEGEILDNIHAERREVIKCRR